MQFYFNIPNLRELHFVANHFETGLGVANRIKPVFSLKSWKPWFFALFNPAKKVLKSAIQSSRYILQNLGMNLFNPG
jgi:hypothetical protein